MAERPHISRKKPRARVLKTLATKPKRDRTVDPLMHSPRVRAARRKATAAGIDLQS